MKKSAVIIISVICALALAASVCSALFAYKAQENSSKQANVQKQDGVDNVVNDPEASDNESSAVLDQKTIDSINLIAEKMNSLMGKDVARENDVTIGGEYVIRSTLQISDAYKSGDRSTLSDRDKETLDMASDVLNKIITDGMSDFDKEVAVYDWMTHELRFEKGSLLVIPQTGEDSDNPYGVLKYHNAVCVGFATTFRLFMQMMDIECMVVHDTSLVHSWDLVKLGEHWYHTDIYSDQSSGNYLNFNMSDSQCASNHDWNRSFFPAADGYEYNFAYINRISKETVWDIAKVVRDALENGDNVIGVEFSETIDEHDAQITEALMNEISYRVEGAEQFNNPSLNWNWLAADGKYVFCCYIYTYEWSDEPVDPGLDDEEYSKINEMIEENFGDIESEAWTDPYYFDPESYYDDAFVTSSFPGGLDDDGKGD